MVGGSDVGQEAQVVKGEANLGICLFCVRWLGCVCVSGRNGVGGRGGVWRLGQDHDVKPFHKSSEGLFYLFFGAGMYVCVCMPLYTHSPPPPNTYQP